MSTQDMRDVILSQGEQITRSLEVNKDVRIEGEFSEIILAGMGGSGHPGDLLNALRVTKSPLTVHRSYNLPRIFTAKPLVITSSYSGNTEEALTAYQTAQKEGYALMVSTSGGTLAEWAERDGAPKVTIDFPGMQPRHTLFAAVTGLAKALSNSGLIEDVTEDLERVATRLPGIVQSLEESGKDLAQNLKDVTPVFTASENLAFAAQNCKIQVNENAKTPAFWNFFPELNHNEMVGFTNPHGKFHVVMLRDTDDHPRNKARMDVTKEFYEKAGITVTEIPVQGSTLLEKIFYAVSFGLWTSYYLALAYDIDPVPVAGVEDFKSRLKEVAGDV